MANIQNRTTIQLKKITKKWLATNGKKDQSFDALLREILSHIEHCDRWWCENR